MEALIGISNPAAATVARTSARKFATDAGWPEVSTEELVICISEIAQNIIDHGGGRGEIRLQANSQLDSLPRIGFSASDHGRGIDALQVVSRERPSGRGNGLAALGRLLNHIEISLSPGPGERLSGWKLPPGSPQQPVFRTVVINKPHPRETVSGDSWLNMVGTDKHRIAIADGLGHGPSARTAAIKAMETLATCLNQPAGDALRKVHESLAGTRGAVVTCMDIDRQSREISVSTAGNTRLIGFQDSNTRWNPVGIDAVLGQPGSRMTPLVEKRKPPHEGIFLLFSDGLSSRIQLNESVPMFRVNPVRSGLGLFALYAGNTDDATLLLVV